MSPPDAGVAWAGQAAAEPPPVEKQKDELEGRIGAALRASAQATSPFAVDSLGTSVRPNPIETRLRIGPEVRFGPFGLLADIETSTGAVSGLPPSELVGERTAHPSLEAVNLREAYLEYRAKTWVVRAGQQASSWGLGLVANPGTHDFAPGEGFGDVRYGDSSYRALLAGRPLYGLGGAWRAIEPAVAADMVVKDDTADYWNAGDRALQGVVAVRFKVDDDRHVGVYTVVRHQRSAHPEDTRGTDAFVVDLAGKWQWKRSDDQVLRAGVELVSISGTSSMAQSETAPVQQIRQFGAALKLAMRAFRLEYYVDAGYASGDQNPYDDKLEGFRFDPDYHVGLILFDEVLGYQSARSSVRGSNPALVGVPPSGVDLLPTRGSVSGAAYLFPRLRYALAEWADVYGGPLVALSTARLTDPYSTRVAGGGSLNALGGRPGGFLGAELDVGAQARFKPHPAMVVSATLEAGLLLPGSAFANEAGGILGPVMVGRARLGVSL